MSANGETGVLNPVERVAEITNELDALLHCDVTQSIGRLPFNFEDTGIDLVTLSGHKICGPTGTGALVASNYVMKQMQPLFHGGGHEGGLRSGSLNVAGIVGYLQSSGRSSADICGAWGGRSNRKQRENL